jgi:hypothetical protein
VHARLRMRYRCALIVSKVGKEYEKIYNENGTGGMVGRGGGRSTATEAVAEERTVRRYAITIQGLSSSPPTYGRHRSVTPFPDDPSPRPVPYEQAYIIHETKSIGFDFSCWFIFFFFTTLA